MAQVKAPPGDSLRERCRHAEKTQTGTLSYGRGAGCSLPQRTAVTSSLSAVQIFQVARSLLPDLCPSPQPALPHQPPTPWSADPQANRLPEPDLSAESHAAAETQFPTRWQKEDLHFRLRAGSPTPYWPVACLWRHYVRPEPLRSLRPVDSAAQSDA